MPRLDRDTEQRKSANYFKTESLTMLARYICRLTYQI